MRNNKKLYESIMKDVSKIIKKHLNETDTKTLVTKYKLINFVQGNSEKCKNFVRRCSKDFIDNFNIKSYDDFSNINPRLLKNILDKHAKNIFKCGFNSLDKKYANGLSDELIRYSMKFAVKNITQDTSDDWAPMYNINESQLHLNETYNPDILDNLTEYLNGNREIAEIFINQASGYVDNAVENGDLQDIEDDELYDFFWDIVADADKKDDAIYNLVDMLKSLNKQWGQRRDSYGFLAELMEEYYNSEYK